MAKSKKPPIQPAPEPMNLPPVDDDLAAMEALGLEIDYSGSDEDIQAAETEETRRLKAMGPREAWHKGSIPFEVAEADLKGLQAQFKQGIIEPSKDWIRVICMRMGEPGKVTASLQAWGARGLDTMKFTPFARSEPLHPLLVANISRQREPRAYGYPWIDFWPEPPGNMVNHKDGSALRDEDGDPVVIRGNCNGKMGFYDKLSKRRISTCIYGDCPHHPMPPGIFHSIHMAQKFISQLKTESVIRAYISNFDPRPEVMQLAQLIISRRQKTLMDAMGLGTSGPNGLVF